MNKEQREGIRIARDEAVRGNTLGKEGPPLRAAGGKHRWPLPPGVEGRAIFSKDGDRRYVLRRQWQGGSGEAAFIGLNPSTAEADVDDPTVRKCWTWAREWGYHEMAMLNVFAYRATSPSDLDPHLDLIGDNEAYLAAVAASADLLVAVWGNSKMVKGYEDTVTAILLRGRTGLLHCVGTNRDGSPRHPLYLPRNTTPDLWRRR